MIRSARLGLAVLLAPGATGVWADTVPPSVPSAEDGRTAESPPPAVGLYVSAPGQFEVVSIDPATGGSAARMGSVIWVRLKQPLALPTALPSPVTVWLVPAENYNGSAPFQVVRETAGRIGVRVRADGTLTEDRLRRAMVAGLLSRVGVVMHGARMQVPAWLEEACTDWVRCQSAPAQFDAWRQVAAQGAPAALTDVLDRETAGSGRAGEAFGLMLWLQDAGGRERWPAFLRRVLGGEDSKAVFDAVYGNLWRSADDGELAWQVAFRQMAEVDQPPFMDAAESREWLRDAGRVVLLDPSVGRETVVSWEMLWSRREDAAVRAEAGARAAGITGRLGAMHPFYHNAALSLGRAFRAVKDGDRKALARARAGLEADMRAGRELEAASKAMLDGAAR